MYAGRICRCHAQLVLYISAYSQISLHSLLKDMAITSYRSPTRRKKAIYISTRSRFENSRRSMAHYQVSLRPLQTPAALLIQVTATSQKKK